MAALTHRAEQALLGAMLCQPGLGAVLDYVENADFAAYEHRVLHRAIISASESWQGGASWQDAVQAAAGPEIPPGFLDELEAACPDPLHGRAYAERVVEAYAHRTLLECAGDIFGQSKTLAYDAGRLVRAGGDGGRHAYSLAQHTGRVADAIRNWATRFDPDTAESPARGLAGAGDERARQEELVLGALIGQHRETRQMLTLLLPGAFTDPLRREVFGAIRVLHATGRAIDQLTVDWELARARAARPGTPAGRADGQPSYVARLAAPAADAGKVTQTAYDLVHRHPVNPGSRRPAVNGSVPGMAAEGASPDGRTRFLQPPTEAHVNGQIPGQRM